ncbi:MAG: baseplate J/gp47 family protein [Chloroflexota bacterium]
MKTRILQLETHDDFLSVRDRLNWVKGGRVLMVWPKRARALERHLDLVLLLHTCSSLGLQLGLVAKDPEIRQSAEELGIPVFDNTRQAQNERWARRRKPKARPVRQDPRPDLEAMRRQRLPQPPQWTLHPLVRALLFTLAILSVLSLALFLLPEAHITLTPERRIQAMVLEVSADPSAGMVTLAGALPARPVNVIVDGFATITTTGTITVPAGFASGNVQFTNLGATALAIPAGSVVSTGAEPAIRFATRQEGKLAAGPGTTVTLAVDALTPGAAGNVPANSIVTLEGPHSFTLAVINPEATHGGKDIFVPAPSARDYTGVYGQLLAQLQSSATAVLAESLLPGDQLISSAVLTETIEEVYQPAQAQAADQLALTLRLQFAGWAVSGSEVEQWVTAVLDANLPAGYTPIPGSLVIEALTNPVLKTDHQSARWQIEARRELQARVSYAEAEVLTRWQTPSKAAQALVTLPLDGPPAIDISPTWWPFIPLRIQVNGGL